ncbi:MAG TPA: patatin-like phospholipase family protein [Dongiaceae bacterium]|jgi:NTE family protein
MSQPRIGLALGGGGARGWAHIGVVKALTRAGIVPDVISGTSVGALVGGLHLAGRLDVLEGWSRGLTKFKIASYLDFRVGGGMIGGHRLSAVLREHLGKVTIEALPKPFTCVATDLLTGHEVWLRKGDLVEMLRASFSLPGLFSPVEVDGRWLVDGALVNPLPVSVCRAMGAHVIIAVNLNADPIGRVRMPGQRIPRAAGFDILQALPQSKANIGVGSWLRSVFGREPDAPSLFGTMTQSLNILLDRVTRSRLAGEPPDVSISPRLGHIGLLEFDRAAEVIAEGEAATERTLAELGEVIALMNNSGGASSR